MANVFEEPSWWADATVVELVSVTGYGPSTQCARKDMDLLPYGVGIPANNTAGWPVCIVSWTVIQSINMIS